MTMGNSAGSASGAASPDTSRPVRYAPAAAATAAGTATGQAVDVYADAAAQAVLAAAGQALREGRVLAYPTEGVFGLGADPFNASAVRQIFALKRRPADVGVLLIAASVEQVLPLIDADAMNDDAWARLHGSWPGPMTWVCPRAPHVPNWVTGGHAGIALRVTSHVPAAALCNAFGGALVSTSANIHGQPPACEVQTLIDYFGTALDGIVDAPLGGQQGSTPIRDAVSGAWLRR